MASDSLTVSFTITPGDVWVDTEGVAWEVGFTEVAGNDDVVHLTRTAVATIGARELVKTWRHVPGSARA